MKITSVKVNLDLDDYKIKGIASVLIDNCFVIHDIRIIKGDKGLFLAMPNHKTNSGKFQDVANPINSKTRKMFEDVIFKEYHKSILNLLSRVNIPKEFELNYDLDNICHITLTEKKSMKTIHEFDIKNYTEDSLKKLSQDINYAINHTCR